MRSIVRGVVALFAAFLMMDVAKAAPTIVSPADYARVMTLTDTMKNLISPLNSDVSIFSKANTTERSNYQTEYFYNNSLPVGLSWSGTTGNCTVKVWRTNGGSESAPFFSEMVSGTSTECYNLEVGCNYTWKVTDSQGNSAVGHFFTEDRAPRIIRGRRSNFTYSSGADCSNGRDIGGWATTNGKRVKQGMIYRSGQLEYCSFKNGSDTYQKMDILYDLLGIRVDVDLRTINNVNSFASWKAEWNNNQPFANPCVSSGIGPNVERFTIEWATLGKGPSDGNPYVYDGKYGCQFPSYSALYNSMSIDYKVGDTKKSYTQTASQNKIAVWAAFNRIYQAVVVDKEPVLFHCSHGKDRTGSLAAVIHGLLGVSEADIKRDFATAWFCNPDYTFTQTSMNTMLTGLKNLDTASTKTLAGGCEKYLISCATSAGDTAGSTKVTEFKTAMLEDVETPEGNVVTPEPEEDTFVYTHYYWRSPSDGGSISSQYNTGPWFTSLNDNSLMTPETQPILYSGTKWDSVRGSYSHCYNFITTSTKKYARTSNAGNPIMVGKLVFDAANGGGIKAGATNFKPFFTSEGHTVSDRTIIEHRGGLVEFDNVDIYLTQWGKDKYTSGRVSAYDGIASVDIWANATMRVKDFISVSPEKTYLKFLSGNSNNARLESLEHDDASYPYNSFGWFTGGAAGTKQYIKVQGAYPLKFSASGKTSGVVGALGLEFEFGANNGTGTAAMLQVAGALNINAGSTITVDAGGNGAGTYKLVSAGTLNDYANLDLRSNYTVTNCKDGYYGTIVKSGNNINLTIQEGTPPIEDEDEGLIDTEKEGDWGYRLKIGNEIVLVFTNHTKSVNWQVPSKLENVQFLVVGGGGGGGADTHASNTHGGAGGGGGGVVTGLVNFAENSVITVSVGAGGNGGVTATQGGSNSKYGAAYSGNASYVIVDGSEYFWTAGGGGDNGANESSNAPKTIGNVGNSGGSSAGSRPGQTERGAVVPSRVASVSNVKYADTSFGRQGGAGYYVTPADDSNTYYGYFSAAGGGGGATTEGETASTAQAAGKGGEGLASDITGTLRVYGSGGGGGAVAGGCGALGGTGAGCGNMTGVTAENYANYVNAVANQGGGGGGAARGIPGGKGGSGIVVLRYIDPDYSDPYVLTVPKAVTGLVYDGTVKTGVEGGTGYTLTGNTATDAGSYTATAMLAEGYQWSDGTTGNKEISWSIAKATNEWTTEPKIEPATWTEGEAAGTLTAGVAKFGKVTSSMTDLPTEVGSYTITYTVAETKNYTGLAATVQFEIKEMVAPGDLIAVKPTVNYASGTKFTAIGVEQKPVVTPANGNGYTVSYEGDFTSAGTHRIVIALKDGWTWNDGTSDTLVFQYTFVDRNFTTEFYASGSGRFQSSSRWYNKALTTKLNAYPTEYTHKAYSTTASSSAHMDDSLETKVGMFVVSGGEYMLTYGVLNFQNETVTPLPMWVTEPGCMTTIQATKMPLNGGGVGYFELGAGATNRFGLVDASENFYIRYATDGDLGSVTEFYDSGDSPVNTKLGWFEGGAEGIVSELIVTNTSVKFAKVGAISGVAGPIVVTVALGENNIQRPSIDVAGTLKINQGSTLNVNANGMPCGVYTIITAGEFIGADILTTDQGGVVTGLAENTSGVIECEGNTIKLYIETTILPTVPGIDGESVSINDVFNSARVSKPIWYKTRPEIIDGKIVFNRIPVEIPEYYNVSVEALTEGYLIKLVLKDNLTPYIGNKVDDDVITTPAIKIENGKVKIHLEGTHEKLHYSLMTSTSLESNEPWSPIYSDPEDNSSFTFGDGVKKLDDSRFFKVGEVSDEPIEKTNE